MTDRIAALAEALQETSLPVAEDWSNVPHPAEEWAAAILAALPPDWCGHHDEITEQDDEIARLRKIEEAARAVDEAWGQDYATMAPLMSILHAALGEE